jgi:hypothetical protein
MNDFSSEFGFLPPDLVFKTHEFVRAYHDTHGSGWAFVWKSHIRAKRSGYLSKLERISIIKGKILRITVVCVAISGIAAFLWSAWFAVIFVLSLLIAFFMDRQLKFGLVQERTLILTMEMLSMDFAGWGTAFPSARQKAQQWLNSIEFGIEGKLLDTYMPPHRRDDFAKLFRPSEETSTAGEGQNPDG